LALCGTVLASAAFRRRPDIASPVVPIKIELRVVQVEAGAPGG